MQRSSGKLIVSKGVGLRAPPKTVTYVAKKKSTKTYKPKEEFKYIDTSGTWVNDTTGAVTLLNGCVPGDDAINREGRQITMRSLECKLTNFATATTGLDQFHRVLIVLDKQANGAAPAITDILVTNNVSAPRNLNNSKRFKILMDKRFYLNAAGEAGTAKIWKKYKKLLIPVQFNNGTAGTVADIITNSLYLVTLGNVAAGGSAGSTQGYIRLRFTE